MLCQVPRLYICVYVMCFVESDVNSLFCVRRRCRSTLLLAAMVASVVHYSGLVLPQIAVLQGSVCGLTAQL